MASKSRKTEHAGAKKGSGAYWGRKKDAKKVIKKSLKSLKISGFFIIEKLRFNGRLPN